MTVGSFNTVSAASILTKLQKDCTTPSPVLRQVADAMAADMRAGLAVDGGSDLKMILSYVDALPTGYIHHLILLEFCIMLVCSAFHSLQIITGLHFLAWN